MADIPAVTGASIHVPTDDTGTPTIQSMITLARRGMRILGTQSDPTIETTALESVQRAVSDINLRCSFDFTITVETDITFVEGQREYNLPSSIFRIKEIALVDATETPERVYPLRYVDWDQLQRLYDQQGTGTPTHWTSRDVFRAKTFELHAAPDSASVDNFKARVWYHQRVERPPLNDPLIEIAGPAELAEVIISYVRYNLLMIYDSENDRRMRMAYQEYRDQLVGLQGSEKRSRPGGAQIKLDYTGVPNRRRWR